MKKDNSSMSSFRPYDNALRQYSPNPAAERKSLLTIKVGAITQWIRDILAIIVLWKLIAVI